MSENYEDRNIVTLEDEDGNEQDFEHIDTVEIDGETYVALVPLEQSETDEDGELIILKVSIVDGEEMLGTVEDENDYRQAVAAFEERLQDEYELTEE